MGLLDWILLILAAIIMPPIIQAIFARREYREWVPECDTKRRLADRLADDRKAESMKNRMPGDVERARTPSPGDSDGDSSLHTEDTML